MASTCVNNNIGVSPESFVDSCPSVKCPSYGWIPEKSDPQKNAKDFEFQLDDPATMLPADELFSDGKLVPLQISTIRRTAEPPPPPAASDTPRIHRKYEIPSTTSDSYMFSPKAPTCSSIRWKELLRLKKLYGTKPDDSTKTTPSQSSNKTAARSLKHLLHRGGSKSSDASSLNLPLLKESDNNNSNEPAPISRLSVSSSSSSGHEHDDLPRLSLDSDKPRSSTHQTTGTTLPKVRVVNAPRVVDRRAAAATDGTGTSPPPPPQAQTQAMDSPRMNASGKIVFQSLERSSSSPSTFNGGPRYKYNGMERSYSANVRVTPVLNVPVCSLRGSSKGGGVFGLPFFSSQQRKDAGSVGASRNGHCRNRTDRT